MKSEAVRLIVPFAVLMLAASLRIAALCKFPLNNDEIAEVSWARRPWGAMMRQVEHDKVHPPLDYLVQHWIVSTECVRRIPAVVAGIATVALIMHIGMRAFGWGAGMFAAFLLSVSPIHIRYSQEIRPYGLGLFALTAAISALLEYERRQERRWGVLWFCCMMVAAYTLYFAALVALITSAALIFMERREKMRALWRSGPPLIAAAAILYLPWLRVVIAAVRQPPFAPRDQLTAAWFSYRLQVLGTGDWRVEPVSAASYLFWILVALGCALAWRSPAGRAVVVWLLAGLFCEILVLQMHPHPSAVRHLLPAWIGAFLLAGTTMSSIMRVRWGIMIAPVLCGVILAGDATTLRAYYDHGRPDWRSVAEFVAARVRPGERVFAANGWVDLNFGYYWREAGTPVPLERLPPNVQITLSGPAWVVVAGCPKDDVSRAALDQQELRLALPYTNHCEVRYLRSGTTISLPHAVCMGE